MHIIPGAFLFPRHFAWQGVPFCGLGSLNQPSWLVKQKERFLAGTFGIPLPDRHVMRNGYIDFISSSSARPHKETGISP